MQRPAPLGTFTTQFLCLKLREHHGIGGKKIVRATEVGSPLSGCYTHVTFTIAAYTRPEQQQYR